MFTKRSSLHARFQSHCQFEVSSKAEILRLDPVPDARLKTQTVKRGYFSANEMSVLELMPMSCSGDDADLQFFSFLPGNENICIERSQVD